MHKTFSQEWWRWRMYKQIADFLHHPSVEREQHIADMLTEYRYFNNSEDNSRDAINDRAFNSHWF